MIILLIFQDSSLGSFEGEPGVSNESLSDIGGIVDTKHKSKKGARQRPLTSLEPSSHRTSSLYAQIDPKKKRRPPSAYLTRSSGRTKSVDPATMTTSLTGLEELTRRKMTNNIRDSRYDTPTIRVCQKQTLIYSESPPYLEGISCDTNKKCRKAECAKCIN